MGEPGRPVRVLVVDDHPLFRAGLRGVVERMPDAEVAGEAADGDAALAAVATTRPDLVVLDLYLPGPDGMTVTARLAERHPDVAVVVLTMLSDDGTVLAALRAGARGYLVKGSDEAEIAAAIRIVAAGGSVLGPAVADAALAVHRGTAAAPETFPQLSAREREVLDRIAAGLPNPVIAAELHLSHQTVRNYVSSIFLKLGVADRAAAIVAARDAGLGTGHR
ncbi:MULTISPECIES: response regulator transcription factor [Pseudonocardia]|uniref:Response regulator transcription factor n=1 Tax=Pseudonocardia alni subsp. carboxydivorans TaxID=415010 RepID=A0ABU9AA97_PSEA5